MIFLKLTIYLIKMKLVSHFLSLFFVVLIVEQIKPELTEIIYNYTVILRLYGMIFQLPDFF